MPQNTYRQRGEEAYAGPNLHPVNSYSAFLYSVICKTEVTLRKRTQKNQCACSYCDTSWSRTYPYSYYYIILLLLLLFTGAYSPGRTFGLPFGVSWSHTQTHGRTPLDEWSARRRDLYLHRKTQHINTTNIHPCPERDSNPRPQQPSGHWDRYLPIQSAHKERRIRVCPRMKQLKWKLITNKTVIR
jgi:hypothetical protein